MFMQARHQGAGDALPPVLTRNGDAHDTPRLRSDQQQPRRTDQCALDFGDQERVPARRITRRDVVEIGVGVFIRVAEVLRQTRP